MAEPVLRAAPASGLPVADRSATLRRAARLLLARRGALGGLVALHLAAAAAGLATPWLIAGLVEDVQRGTTAARVDTVVLMLAGFLVLHTLLTKAARYASGVYGERVLSDLRTDFLDDVVALPLGTVERAGTGDLLTRATTDVDQLARSVRLAVPEIVLALVTMVAVAVAATLAAPLAAASALLIVPALWVSTRWYLRRALSAYLSEQAAFAAVNTVVVETVDGARTVEALRRGPDRVERTDRAIANWLSWERYTLYLRTVWFPSLESAYVVPMVATLVTGGLLHIAGLATLGQVTAVVLYAQQIVDPLDRLLTWLDELQLGEAALARVTGVSTAREAVPPVAPSVAQSVAATPAGSGIEATGLRFGYRAGRDVLHSVDLEVRPGERLALVGPSGAGKSTLGRLLAGSHLPRTGRVTVGGVPLAGLSQEQRRRRVALVTQEHHVFVGSLADNLRMADPSAHDATLWQALEVVGAADWARAVPAGLATKVGSGGLALTAGQAQQVALARLVLADPPVLVLDEATADLDPRAARRLERSLAGALAGRTVIAIAHRLQTAAEADRVAVMLDGRVTEVGSHDELVAAGGVYASLWRSWRASTPKKRVAAASAGRPATVSESVDDDPLTA